MKKHKIRNVDIEVCCAEQKIASNFLFSWGLNKHDKDYACECVKRAIYEEMNGTRQCFHPTDWTKYDYEYIIELFCASYDKYIEANTPIFTSYEQIGSFVRLEV